jgi:ABC-type Fe3+ transport system permease subunit
MNKTQKGAWCNIAGTIFVFASVSYLIVQIGIRHMPPSRIVLNVTLCSCVLITGISLYFLRKKQSPTEPDSDERDNQIKQKAWIAAFVSVWPLFLAASIAPQFFVGLDGSIPVWSLPIVTVFLFYIVLLVYSIAVLIQYGCEGKGKKS